jgi:hypothetical protein
MIFPKKITWNPVHTHLLTRFQKREPVPFSLVFRRFYRRSETVGASLAAAVTGVPTVAAVAAVSGDLHLPKTCPHKPKERGTREERNEGRRRKREERKRGRDPLSLPFYRLIPSPLSIPRLVGIGYASRPPLPSFLFRNSRIVP